MRRSRSAVARSLPRRLRSRATRRRYCGVRGRGRPPARSGDIRSRRSSRLRARETTLIPSRSSTRAPPPHWCSATATAAQPSSISTRRAWRAGERGAAAGTAAGILSCSVPGSSGRSARPAFSNAANVAGRGDMPQPRAQQALARGPLHALLGFRAADVEQRVIAHAGRAGRLAVAARQAAVEMLLRALAARLAFEQLLDQVDAPARPVELVAEPW